MPLVGDEVDRIDLTDGEWADIQREYSQGDQATISAASARGALYDPGSNTVDVIPADQMIQNAMFATLELGVKAWSFVDAAGEPIPVTPATLRKLRRQDFAIIRAAINERNRRFTEAEVKA